MPPTYRLWKTRGQGYTVHQGRRTYFPGPYGSDESLEAFRRFCRSLEPSSVTLEDLAHSYLEHCGRVFGKETRTSTGNARDAIREVLEVHQDLRASDFSPKRLKAVLDAMVAKGLARATINTRLGWVRAWIRWAVSEELVPVTVLQSLQTVRGVPRWRGVAPEPKDRSGLVWTDVEGLLGDLPDSVRAMVLFQWWTGARSGNVVRARPEEFSEGPDGLLVWTPKTHKTEWRGKSLTVFVGPRCRAEVGSWLKKGPWCFPTGSRRGLGRYTVQSYRRAIVRAQKRTGGKLWTPHQLRHARAQLVRDSLGIEAAQAVLGHAHLSATALYAAKVLQEGRRAALAMG